MTRLIRHKAKQRLTMLLLICSIVIGLSLHTRPAQASCMCAGLVEAKGHATAALITQEFSLHKQFLTGPYYDFLIQPTLDEMTRQFTATAFTQIGMIGSFFDAKHQLETQLVLDQYYVDAVRDYQPSTALCKFGTATAGLASSEQRANVNQSLFMRRSLDRHLGNKGSSAASAEADLKARLDQFAEIYCDPSDNDGELAGQSDSFCGVNAGVPERYNKDINYTRTLDSPLTLDINLTDTESTADETDVIALATNLFGYELLSRPDITKLRSHASEYHAARAAIAKRSVAENSFYAIASEKAAGTGASKEHLIALMEVLGYPDNDINGVPQVERILGENPSYYAQMELLTKKIYQDPNFVVSLIDKPANVDRQKAAMQSFRLMQQRDFYNSLIRQEMVLSVILEELLYERFNKVAEDIQ